MIDGKKSYSPLITKTLPLLAGLVVIQIALPAHAAFGLSNLITTFRSGGQTCSNAFSSPSGTAAQAPAAAPAPAPVPAPEKNSKSASSLFERARAAANQTRKSAMDYEKVAAAMTKGMEDLAHVAQQVKELSCQATECSGIYAKTVAKQSLAAIWRILQFDGDIDGIRTGIVIPLAGILRYLRESQTPQDKAQALARMTVYGVEAPIKVQKALPHMTFSVVPNAVIGAQVQTELDSGDLAKSLLVHVTKHYVLNVVKILRTPGLTLDERINQMKELGVVFESALAELAEKLGWYDLDREISQWRTENTVETNSSN